MCGFAALCRRPIPVDQYASARSTTRSGYGTASAVSNGGDVERPAGLTEACRAEMGSTSRNDENSTTRAEFGLRG